ncbi:MAG: MoaD/ThiS family protein [Chloroflexota bacterium]
MLIHVEILPWLSNSMRPNQLGSIKFEHESSGTSFRDLLEELSKADPAFANLIYDSEAGEMRYPAQALVNGQFLHFLGGLDAKISDGDIVTFIATYTGG